MRVYIANFGEQNYLWPQCRDTGVIATRTNRTGLDFWRAGDRTGFITYAQSTLKTARGDVPTKPVASRWFSIMEAIANTSGDLWIHREKGELWWTWSEPSLVVVNPANANSRAVPSDIFEMLKPSTGWSEFDEKGRKLSWDGLHPKARDFLSTEGTLQTLSDDNAAYALALVRGEDLEPWHEQKPWKQKAATSRKGAVKVFSALERSVHRMVGTVKSTVAAANGQKELRTIKNKLWDFESEQELSDYIRALFAEQDGKCALTGIRLELDGEEEDKALLCSLDRIDSKGHYGKTNLQVVCRFVNKWKSDSADAEFRRLLSLVRSADL